MQSPSPYLLERKKLHVPVLVVLGERRMRCLQDLVRATAIRPQDIQRTLEEIGVLRYVEVI